MKMSLSREKTKRLKAIGRSLTHEQTGRKTREVLSMTGKLWNLML